MRLIFTLVAISTFFLSLCVGLTSSALAKTEKGLLSKSSKAQAPAETQADASRLPKGAIQIKSDAMESKDQEGVVIFTGSVVARQDDLTIDTDRLEVFYQKQAHTNNAQNTQDTQNGTANRSIDKVVAIGHVRITKGTRVATGEKAVYEKAAEKITISGSAQVWEGQSRVKGETIIFYVNEDRSVVQSSGHTKVEAVVMPTTTK